MVALSLFTVYDQYRGLIPSSIGGDVSKSVEYGQLYNLEQVVHGRAGDPWQYRIASAWIALRARDVARVAGFHKHQGVVGFLGWRVLQNIAIFGLAWLLYRRLGLGPPAAALGLVLVAYAMTQALYHAGLAWDTYGDVALYLGAALLILARRYAWIVPLSVVAALNRDTGGLIPVMLIATAVPLGLRTAEGRRAALLGLAALAAFGVTIAAVRIAMGPSKLIVPEGHHQGWELFKFNVTRGVTWDNVFKMVTVIPLLALIQWRSWPPALRVLAVTVVPVWLVVHFFGAVVAETRLLLVPYVLVAVPGALAGLRAADAERRVPSAVSGAP